MANENMEKKSSGKVMLEVRNLKTKYVTRFGEDVYAVDGVSFKIEEGKSLGIAGESGCGKSTLARTLLRLYEPDGGQIFFNGVDVTKMKGTELRKQRRDFQMIFQDP